MNTPHLNKIESFKDISSLDEGLKAKETDRLLSPEKPDAIEIPKNRSFLSANWIKDKMHLFCNTLSFPVSSILSFLYGTTPKASNPHPYNPFQKIDQASERDTTSETDERDPILDPNKKLETNKTKEQREVSNPLDENKTLKTDFLSKGGYQNLAEKESLTLFERIAAIFSIDPITTALSYFRQDNQNQLRECIKDTNEAFSDDLEEDKIPQSPPLIGKTPLSPPNTEVFTNKTSSRNERQDTSLDPLFNAITFDWKGICDNTNGHKYWYNEKGEKITVIPTPSTKHSHTISFTKNSNKRNPSNEQNENEIKNNLKTFKDKILKYLKENTGLELIAIIATYPTGKQQGDCVLELRFAPKTPNKADNHV